ncbi:unnamed protein product, partial [Closterium sp. NIES-54]
MGLLFFISICWGLVPLFPAIPPPFIPCHQSPLCPNPSSPSPGQVALLHQHLLELLPSLRRAFHLPTGAHHPGQGEGERHVPSISLLHQPPALGSSHGVAPPHALRPHHLLHGFSQAHCWVFFCIPLLDLPYCHHGS